MAPKLVAQSSFALDFLRRLLCAHSASDAASAGIAGQRGDGAAAGQSAAAEEGAEGRSPCIVARLMGLDAMPAAAQAPLRRSRSASSAEGWPPPPTCYGEAPQPRVIRTSSASFRERPTYLRPENDEFLLLSFSPDGDDDDGKPGSLLASRSDDDADEITGRRGKRRDTRAKKQNRGRRRRRGDEEAESPPGRSRTPSDCGLQNSSPVSVLEARDGQEESSAATSTTSSSSMEGVEQAELCSPSSGEIQPASRQQQGSRRKLLQPDSGDHCGGLPTETENTCGVLKCSDRESNRRAADKAAEVITLDASTTGIWQLIGRLVQEDISGGTKWEARDDANIAADMESEILDHLICEATDELIQLI